VGLRVALLLFDQTSSGPRSGLEVRPDRPPPDAAEHSGRDPDLGGRGLRAHNVTQNLLARAVRNAGHEPRGARPDEPQFDLAWGSGDVVWVAEVKSITPQNEERQLRTALGQVLRYRQLLESEGRTVKAMLPKQNPQIHPGSNFAPISTSPSSGVRTTSR
jgi:hypothetical protein